jgi:hypothetical protein
MGALLLIILLVVRKDIKDIQMGVDYIYNNQDKLNYIYKVLREVRKEREKKATQLRKGKT